MDDEPPMDDQPPQDRDSTGRPSIPSRAEIERRFASLMGHDDLATDGIWEAERLLEATLLIGAHARPGEVDVPARLHDLRAMASCTDPPTLPSLVKWLFDELGFRGDTEDYAAAENSYLDRVLDRRRGLPVTLAVLTVGVGRMAGIPARVVGMPGHVLVGDPLDSDLFIDVFAGGRRIDADEARRIFETLHPPTTRFNRSYLAPTPDRLTVARVLANLQEFHRRERRHSALADVLRLRRHTGLGGHSLDTVLVKTLVRAGRFDEAADELESMARLTPDAGPHAADMEAAAARLRARLN